MENSELAFENRQEPLTKTQASLYLEALNLSIEHGWISRTLLQRYLSIGYRFADSIFNWMEGNGYIEFGDKDMYERKTLITRDEFKIIKSKLNLPLSKMVILRKKKEKSCGIRK